MEVTEKGIALKMIGLDLAGKTTILYELKLGTIVETIPPIPSQFWLLLVLKLSWNM